MLKLAIIGRYADILPFRAIGAELIQVQDDSKAGVLLKNLKHSSEPYMVMMTEDLAGKCPEEIDDFRQNEMNIFLSIPSLTSTPGTRMEEIRTLVSRSLGVDLLGQKKGQNEG